MYINEPWIWVLLGDPFYVFGHPRIFHFLISLSAFIVFISRITIIYYERREGIRILIIIFHKMITFNESNLGLKHHRRFILITKINGICILPIMHYRTLTLFKMCNFYVSFKAYQDMAINFSLHILIVSYLSMLYFYS